MGPLSAVNIGLAGAGANVAPVSQSAPDAGAAHAAVNGTDSLSLGGAGMALAAGRAFTEVSDLLRSIGGGLENDKLLRTMIALLIILALLERVNEGGQGVKDSLRDGGGANSRYIGVFSTSTTISIEQSSTTVIMADGANAFGTEAGPEAAGGLLDLSA